MKPQINIQQALALVHVAEKKLKEDPHNKRLKNLTDSVVSIVVLYLRHPTALVNLQQLNIYNRLRNYIEESNIHTLQEKE
jgi:dsRNA-specific ribonuclease